MYLCADIRSLRFYGETLFFHKAVKNCEEVDTQC
jgi:hypothetical protein